MLFIQKHTDIGKKGNDFPLSSKFQSSIFAVNTAFWKRHHAWGGRLDNKPRENIGGNKPPVLEIMNNIIRKMFAYTDERARSFSIRSIA